MDQFPGYTVKGKVNEYYTTLLLCITNKEKIGPCICFHLFAQKKTKEGLNRN